MTDIILTIEDLQTDLERARRLIERQRAKIDELRHERDEWRSSCLQERRHADRGA